MRVLHCGIDMLDISKCMVSLEVSRIHANLDRQVDHVIRSRDMRDLNSDTKETMRNWKPPSFFLFNSCGNWSGNHMFEYPSLSFAAEILSTDISGEPAKPVKSHI